MRKKKINICVYCGTPEPETRDHVPPKAIFAEPLPNNLITAPCCEGCRVLTSKDDEYFRDMLTMRHDTYENPDVQKIIGKVFRSYSRPEKKKAFKELLGTIREVEVRTPSGISLKNASTYGVNKDRLDNVVERIVRALYWYERNKVYPSNGMIKAYTVDFLSLNEEKIKRLNQFLAVGEEKIIGENAFKYKMSKMLQEGFELWLLTFYDKVQFLAFLIPSKGNTIDSNEAKGPNSKV